MSVDFGVIVLMLVIISLLAFPLGRMRVARTAARQASKPHSLSFYYGLYALLWTFVPAMLVLLAWTLAYEPLVDSLTTRQLRASYPDASDSFLDLRLAQVKNIASGLLPARDAVIAGVAAGHGEALMRAEELRLAIVLAIALGCAGFALVRITPSLKSRIRFETFLQRAFFLASIIAILTTIGIVVSLIYESVRFFAQYPIFDFFFGSHWSPLRSFSSSGGAAGDHIDGAFGMLPVMAGTVLVACIAMLVAVPIGLLAAIYMAEFAHPYVHRVIKPTLEVLAGVPTVVYGFFAALTVGPFIRDVGLLAGLEVSAQSALAAGGVMGIMIIPFISSLSDDVITAVPQSLRDGGLAVGSTHGETITKIVLPAAFPGLIGAFLLAISRAIGETMIVVMAAGVSAQLTANPLDSVTTVTVQIVSLLTGDTEFDSVKTLSAFALGITLFVMTLMLNIAALGVARRVGGGYE